MSLDDTRDLESELMAAIGQERLIALAEKIGGFRFYVPQNLALTFNKYRIDEETLTTLASLYGGEYIIIPLAKQLRAQKMWADGASYADIARALVMTESGVFRLLKRKPRPVRKRNVDTRQMNLL